MDSASEGPERSVSRAGPVIRLCYRLAVVSPPGLSAEGTEELRISAKATPAGTCGRRRMTLAALILFAVGVPYVLALATHSLSIPHNDSWSYSKIAQIFARTGQIHLQNWNRSALIGQVVVFGPLGRWIWAEQTAIAVLGVVGLLLTYRILARRLAPEPALLGTALVAVFPAYGLLSTSFMNVIPAYVAALTCIAVADVAIERRSPLLLGAALAFGFFGATIREEDLVAVVAVLATALFTWGRQRVRTVVALTIILAMAVATFEIWRMSLPDGDRPALRLSLLAAVGGTARGYLTLALFLAPAVLVSGVLRHPSRLGAALSLPAAAVGVASVVHFPAGGFLGNYLSSNGAYALANIGGGTATVIPGVVMDVLVALALVSATALPAVVVTRWRELDPMLAVLGVLAVLVVIGEWFARELVFDRDLIVLLVPGAVLCLRKPAPAPHRSLATVPLAGLAAVSLLLCANALARDAAVWGAADTLVARGIPATSIDAGLDWVGYHATTPARGGPRGEDSLQGFWEPMFPRSQACYEITVRPLPGLTPFERVSYRTYAVLGTSRLDVYRVRGCTPRPSVHASG